MTYCKTCLTPITRPRVVFTDGICNSCWWVKRKNGEETHMGPPIRWADRTALLRSYCDRWRDYAKVVGVPYNILVPCSGGKDGSYVAWKMKHEFNMNPLCVTFSPPIPTAIGRHNLDAFRDSGFDLLEIRPNPKVYRELCKRMFISQARCKFPFVIGIATAISRISLQMTIPFIIYGEEGETEYGGSDQFENEHFLSPEYLSIYHENNNIPTQFTDINPADLFWWTPPTSSELRSIHTTWWSKYESWNDQLHRDLAQSKCGLLPDKGSTSTFTDYAQLDDVLQDLHMYECFIKYGTGRATADANLAIKSGRITRSEALTKWDIESLDSDFPMEHLSTYLRFFRMTEQEFFDTISSHVNHTILKKNDDKEHPWVLRERIT